MVNTRSGSVAAADLAAKILTKMSPETDNTRTRRHCAPPRGAALTRSSKRKAQNPHSNSSSASPPPPNCVVSFTRGAVLSNRHKRRRPLKSLRQLGGLTPDQYPIIGTSRKSCYGLTGHLEF